MKAIFQPDFYLKNQEELFSYHVLKNSPQSFPYFPQLILLFYNHHQRLKDRGALYPPKVLHIFYPETIPCEELCIEEVDRRAHHCQICFLTSLMQNLSLNLQRIQLLFFLLRCHYKQDPNRNLFVLLIYDIFFNQLQQFFFFFFFF